MPSQGPLKRANRPAPQGPGSSVSNSAPSWSQQRVARELETWFDDRTFDVWPAYRTFARDGRKRLHSAVVRTGGAQRWAPELGVHIVQHLPGRRFNDDDIDTALRTLLRAHQPVRFPSHPWLVKHGPPGLASAVRSSGGAEHWATRLGIPLPSPARWTDQRLEAELRRLCAGRMSWPTRAEFQVLKATGAVQAVDNGHGSKWWAERLGNDSRRDPEGSVRAIHNGFVAFRPPRDLRVQAGGALTDGLTLGRAAPVGISAGRGTMGA